MSKQSHSSQNKISAIFLDRDGVINLNAKEHDYIKSWQEFKFYKNALRALKKINQLQIPTFIITNQRGISRGIMSDHDLKEIHEKMIDEIRNCNGCIEKIYSCPHGHEDKCICRKPNPGMLLSASKEYSINLSKTVLIGDTKSDIQAGKSVGCITILVKTGLGKKQDVLNWEIKPDYICKDLLSATKIVTNLNSYKTI